MILGGMGFGQVPAGPNLARQAHLRRSFGPSLALTAASLGFPVDELDVQGALAVATHDVEIAAGLVPAGTVGAQLNRVRGLRDRVPVISFTATWYVTQDVEPLDDTEWTFRSSGWRVLVHGDTPLDVTIGYPVDPSEYADFSPNLTAHRPVNCIPAVCAAAPGIVTTAELPLIVPRLGAAAH
jgi:4-hydroxy-tetrahydrodipicolinate reductase